MKHILLLICGLFVLNQGFGQANRYDQPAQQPDVST